MESQMDALQSEATEARAETECPGWLVAMAVLAAMRIFDLNAFWVAGCTFGHAPFNSRVRLVSRGRTIPALPVLMVQRDYLARLGVTGLVAEMPEVVTVGQAAMAARAHLRSAMDSQVGTVVGAGTAPEETGEVAETVAIAACRRLTLAATAATARWVGLGLEVLAAQAAPVAMALAKTLLAGRVGMADPAAMVWGGTVGMGGMVAWDQVQASRAVRGQKVRALVAPVASAGSRARRWGPLQVSTVPREMRQMETMGWMG